MKSEWLIFDENKSLIVFCNGWGMDIKPFRPLESSNHDVLVFYDYSAEFKDNNIEKLADIYNHIHLVCWSMGVFYGQKHFNEVATVFTRKIAINGTLYPVDDQHGIPDQICRATLEAFDEASLIKFYRRMCRSGEIFEQFMQNRPERSVADLRNELFEILQNSQTISRNRAIFSDIFISQKDLVVPTENQNRFWEGGNINYLPGGHFPFYLWKSWDQIVEEECRIAVNQA